MAKGAPMMPREQRMLARAIEAEGLKGAARRFGVSPDTLGRAGSGAGVHPSTRQLLRMRLAGMLEGIES